MNPESTQASKPLPVVRPETRPFWSAAGRGELRLQHCAACGGTIFFPRRCCPTCLSDDLVWRRASGLGRVYSFTVIRKAARPCFEPDVPYVYAMVELKEGPRLMTNIVGLPPDEVTIGMPVRVDFEPAGPGLALPRFKPTTS